MKIATITCQHVYNYGATLQAYALQAYLESLGNDVEVIQFVPWYHHRYEFWYLSRSEPNYAKIKENPILRFFYCMRYHRWMFKYRGRKNAFDKFDNKYLHLTNELYETSEELKNNPPQADLYIAGSDQIWNTDMINGTENAYFLDFGDNLVKRVSYAASFGISCINVRYESFIKKHLSCFDRISVRESTALNILSSLNISGAIRVLDPVFLISKEKWLIISKKSKKYKLPKKYILLYNFIDDEVIRVFTLNCSKKYKLPIISIVDSGNINYADIVITDAGPLEFINMINNAELVIANSFHATAFSIILDKDFYTFPLPLLKNSSRMEDLLSCLKIENRFNPSSILEQSIDYFKVKELLEQEICKSRDFLMKCILS